MDTRSIDQQAANATKWSTITEIAAKCVTPITNMILARLLTPEAFGVVATVTMVVSFADMFTDAGFQKYLIQHDFKSQKELDENTDVAFWTNLTISILLWLLIASFRNQLAKAVGNAGLGNVIVVASLSLPLTSFSSIQMARFRREFDFKSLFYIRLISILVPFLVTVPLAIMTRDYWALVYGTLIGNFANAIALTLCSQWKPRIFFRASILKEMFSYSWWILMESIANWISGNIGTFIVSSFLTTYFLGLYKTSMTTVNQIMNLITAATSAPLFVALSRLKNNQSALLETYYRFIYGLSFFLCPMGVGIWLYRDFITSFLLGAQWEEAADFIGLWGLSSSIVLLLGTYCNGLYNAVGKTKLSFFSQILHLVVLVPALYWGASRGFEVLYQVRCVTRLELILVQMLFMKVFMKASLLKIIIGLVPAAICTMVMTGVGLLLQQLGQGMVWSLMSVFVCIVSYFIAGIVLFKKKIISAFALFGVSAKKEIHTNDKK